MSDGVRRTRCAVAVTRESSQRGQRVDADVADDVTARRAGVEPHVGVGHGVVPVRQPLARGHRVGGEHAGHGRRRRCIPAGATARSRIQRDARRDHRAPAAAPSPFPPWPLTHPRFRAAAVQAAPAFLDLDAGIDKAIALIAEAAANGAKLIAFPETWLPGYPWFIWLDSPAWGMQFFQRYHDNSLVYGSPEAEKLAAAAREHGITVVDGPVASGAAAASTSRSGSSAPDGETIAQRRKLKPTHVERTVFGEGDGSDLSVYDDPARPHRRALLLGAPAAAVEVRDVRAERAGAHRGVAELLALPRRRLRARPGGQQRRQPHLRGRGRLLRGRPVRDRLAGDDRAAVHRRRQEGAAAARRRLRRASTRPTARCCTSRWPRTPRASSTPTSTSA